MIKILSVLVLVAFAGVHAPAVAAPIQPGDVIFTSVSREWYRFRPSTLESRRLPWEETSIFTSSVHFDPDGTLLTFDRGLKRINPTGGATIDLELPGFTPGVLNFGMASNGDYFISTGQQIVRRNGVTGERIWFTTFGAFTSFQQRFVVGPNNDVYVYDAGEGVIRVDSTTGDLSLLFEESDLPPGLWFNRVLVTPRNGASLFASDVASDIWLLDYGQQTAEKVIDGDNIRRFGRFDTDAESNLWVPGPDGLYKYDVARSTNTLVHPFEGISLQLVAVVPPNWTAPVPEPTATAIFALAATLITPRCRRR